MPVFRPPCLESDAVVEEPSKWSEEAVEGREACPRGEHFQAFARSPRRTLSRYPTTGDCPQFSLPPCVCTP